MGLVLVSVGREAWVRDEGEASGCEAVVSRGVLGARIHVEVLHQGAGIGRCCAEVVSVARSTASVCEERAGGLLSEAETTAVATSVCVGVNKG